MAADTYYDSSLTGAEVDEALLKVRRLNENILINVSDDADANKTADAGWAASPSALAKVGTQIVTGKIIVTGQITNGGAANVAELSIPSKGTWLVSMFGWWPESVSSGYIDIPNVCAVDKAEFQFNMTGIYYASGPTTLYVKLTNWSESPVSGINMSASTLKAVKISA